MDKLRLIARNSSEVGSQISTFRSICGFRPSPVRSCSGKPFFGVHLIVYLFQTALKQAIR